MKRLHLHHYSLLLLAAALLCQPLCYAADDKKDKAATEEAACARLDAEQARKEIDRLAGELVKAKQA